MGHAKSTDSTVTNTIKSDLEDPSNVGIKEADLTSASGTSSEGLLPSPSSTSNPLQNSETMMTTSEMLLSTTGEMSSRSTVGSTPIVEGTFGVSNVHPATMVTSTMPLSSAAYTRSGSAVESSTLALKATTLAMAKAADIRITATITSRAPVTLTSSVPGQVRSTMVDAPSRLADLPGDVGHISWSTGMPGGSSDLGTITSPATPLSTNSKVTGAVGEVTQPINSATFTLTSTVKETNINMLKEKTTTTDVASADIAEPTVGRQTNRLKKSFDDFTTPNVDLTVSSQMTTSTQKELDAPTAAPNPSRASASPAFSEPSPAEVGQTTPVPAITVSYQTGWAVSEVAGTLEGENSTKEGQHSTLTTITLPVNITPVKKNNSLLQESSAHPAQIPRNSQTAE
ncbi:unnamed protein product [Dibothriocephalus latus]|uniref:Uncharacterized protein n=1 Tax=Dibothriocephalus latus TaxID=60516 RepID=A0A3P6TMG2_DIBLA|nr:unnamed protein product [Dibothriocephalus latus]